MKITLNWLRELVHTELSAAEIAAHLTAAGLEVEGIEELGRELDGIVVAEIVRVDPHPNADRLVLCLVRDGSPAPLPVVCGARNMHAGDRVALARPGVSLPDGRRIEAAEIRGVRSQGMLCSAAEMGLEAASEGILVLDSKAEVGQAVSAALDLRDTVLEIGVTPNRGDCLSILGVARELAALTDAKLSRQRRSVREKGTSTPELVTVRIADPDLCWRYAARVVTSVQVRPSPRWMQQRLLAVGLHPVNNLVDVTNYVMIERGQPLHAFDFDLLPHPEIVVRRAGDTQRFRALDGIEYTLEPDDLLITTGREAVAIAGVMGGGDSSVSEGTRRVLLESAWFQPTSVRRTSKRLGLATESAYRFERGVDVEGVDAALDRAAMLLAQISGGNVAPGVVDEYPQPFRPAPIQFRVQRTQELLGVEIDRGRITGALKAVGASISGGNRGVLSVTAPSHRSDLVREIDLIEEVARVTGYDGIPVTLPRAEIGRGSDTPIRTLLRDLRALLSAQGWCEAISYSFVSERMNGMFGGLTPDASKPMLLLNPLSSEHGQMRFSLLPGLVEAVRHNLNQGERSIALFGAGRVFWQEEGKRSEQQRLAGVLQGTLPVQGIGAEGSPARFEDVKGVLELILSRFDVEAEWKRALVRGFHPGTTAEIVVDAGRIGVVGGLHPDLQRHLEIPAPCWLFELDAATLVHYPPSRSFKELPRFPGVVRDLAIVAEEDFVAGEVVRFVWDRAHEWIEAVRLFDLYRGAPVPPGKKSLAYSVTYRAADRTLTDDEVNEVHEKLTAALTSSLGVELRR